MTQPRDVTALMRREFASSKLCWVALLVLQVVAVATSIVSLQVGDRAAPFLASAGLLVPVLTALARSRAGAYQGRGEEVRKALLLADGWGHKVDLGLVLVRIAQSSLLPGWDTPPLGSYFNSTRPPGPRRVLHILQQSAFFTARHASTAFWLCAVAASVVGGGGMFMIWAAAQGETPFAHATDVGAALLAFAVGGEVLSVGLAFRRLAAVASSTVISCEALARETDPTPADLTLALSAYDCAVAQAPPIPSSIYLVERARLERAWARYKGPT
jgi:hypothetical protein